MTNEPSDHRFARNPALQALHDSLRREDSYELGDLTADPEGIDDAADGPAQALQIGMFAPEVQEYVDRLLSVGENPSPELRKRLTDTAGRALEYRRRDSRPLPVMLAARRAEERISAADLAERLGVSEQEIYDRESGEVATQTLQASSIVDWARVLDLPAELTVSALRAALELTAPSPMQNAAAGRGHRRQLSDDAERLLAEVQGLLDA